MQITNVGVAGRRMLALRIIASLFCKFEIVSKQRVKCERSPTWIQQEARSEGQTLKEELILPKNSDASAAAGGGLGNQAVVGLDPAEFSPMATSLASGSPGVIPLKEGCLLGNP